jgi:GntR family transcriptional regulator/MocR family aminotransferase
MAGVERPENWERYPYPFIYGQADPTLFDHQNWRPARCGRWGVGISMR